MINSYVISVPSLYHRLDKSFWPSFNTVESIKPILYPGVEGKNYPLPSWWVEREKGGCIYPDTFEPAVWGLVQTYLNLFTDIIEHKISEPILILEDDSVIIDPTTFDLDLKLFIDNLPDQWVVGYISGYHGKNKKEQENEFVMKVSSVMQTNAVLYNGYVACQRLKDYIENTSVREPIDVLFLLAYNNLNIPLYRSIKKLIYQDTYQCSTVTYEYKPGIKLDWEIK